MRRYACIIVMLLGAISMRNADANNEKMVFQIGTFDRDYAEFAISDSLYLYSEKFPNDVHFRAGIDNPKEAWPFIHPGPSDAWAGSRSHPFMISFRLDDAPRGEFILRIGLVSSHGSGAPRLQADINGFSDSIQIPNGASDAALTDPTQGKPYEIKLVIAPQIFKRGENKMVLTCSEGSWILYDAISLTNNPDISGLKAALDNVSLNPTFRFIKRPNGLKQIVELNAKSSIGGADCTIDYQIGSGKPEALTVRSGLFGAISQELELDDLSKPVHMSARISIMGDSKTCECEVNPIKKWKLYVLPSAHVDIGYTDIQPNVIDVHNRNTNKALDLMREYPDFKWNMEAAWATENFLRMATESQRDEFIRRAKERRIGCQVIYGNMLTGLLSHEEQFRTLYPAKLISREYDIPFEMAMSCDVPTQVWTTPMYLAQSGIKYFASGINIVGGDPFAKAASKSPFYWEGPDGSRVLSWLAFGYAQAMALGLSSSTSTAKHNIDGFLRGFNRDDYPYDAVLAFGGFPDNWTINSRLAEVVAEWNSKYEYPKVILCTGPEFFKYLESKYKDAIPVMRGDGGTEWEDGAGSTAYETAITRQAKEQLVTAEKLYSLASIIGDAPYPCDDFWSAWIDAILYDEHTWGAAGSVSDPNSYQTRWQWAYKKAFATRASKAADDLQTRAFDAFSDVIGAREGSYLVFNPHSWTLSAPVNADGMAFFASEVPPLGYKIFSPDVIEHPSDEIPSTSNIMENKWYRIEIDQGTGAVISLYDKELDREMVDRSAKVGVNQYMYVTGDGPSAIDSANITNVSIGRSNSGIAQLMSIKSSALNTPSIVTNIILYDDIKRIDFDNEIEKVETYDKEAGYFAFPFKIDNPVFNISIPNGIVSPNADMLPGGCMSWYTAQDFVSVHNDDVAIVWSAADSPLVTIGDISRYSYGSPAFTWPMPIKNGQFYAYLFNNYWFTNYKASQDGKLRFRFSLTSMKKYSPTEAMKFGQSFRAPMLARRCSESNLPEDSDSMSFFSVEPKNIIITNIKKAEAGNGYVIRLLNTGDSAVPALVSLPSGIKKAWKCNQVEDIESELDVINGEAIVRIQANGVAAVLVK